MPYDDPDLTDPMTLHGVAVPAADDSSIWEMAACFIEEYARLGFDEEQILHMFRVQGYAGPALARRVLGDKAIELLVRDELAKWGRHVPGRIRVERGGGGFQLPVVES